MTLYSSLESMFPRFQETMKEHFGDKISNEIDYILLMDYTAYPLYKGEDDRSNINIYEKALSKFLKPMKTYFPTFNNYVIDFVFCLLYFNNMLTHKNFIDSMQIFEKELIYIDQYPYPTSIHGFTSVGFNLRIEDETLFKHYNLFDFNPYPMAFGCYP